ncbi:acyl-CoA dehydrogenase [Xylophilus sp. GOD-11R]|uniref:acyl-CoA dehydrogenase n=1 Tax=Xylophilus sp. GOD-11R TaxID=3089814 RepID=UPI00298C45F2|nr:acyl-CoA dehydrogenase [Xylophilus sp. GOD-11R]WPB57485.1 acyl-CoA dehydrogenase [Xylophilus sp. GOD-11R]
MRHAFHLAEPASVQARDLARLRRHAAPAEAAGGLTPAQQAVLHRRGWLRLLAPREAGGAECPLPAMVRLEEAVAATDGSCGWVLTLCAGAGWFAGFLPPALARTVTTTRRVCIAGSGAPTGHADREGAAWRITGRWQHASGAPMASHYTLVAVLREHGEVLLDDDGAPRTSAFILPANQVDLEPGWFAIGMRASGSWAYAVDSALVPDSHRFSIAPAAATARGPLYRFDFLSLAWVTLAANLAGMARHFVELADPLVRQRRPMRAAVALGDDPAIQRRLDLATCGLGDTWQRMTGELDVAWTAVVTGRTLAADRRGALRDSAVALVRSARDAVDSLYPCCGLEAADTRAEINRVWRDFHTASQHALLVPGSPPPVEG